MKNHFSTTNAEGRLLVKYSVRQLVIHLGLRLDRCNEGYSVFLGRLADLTTSPPVYSQQTTRRLEQLLRKLKAVIVHTHV